MNESVGSSEHAIWGALADYAEHHGSFASNQMPWSNWLGAAYEGLSLEDLYVELIVRCAKVIARTQEPAFQLKKVSRGGGEHEFIEVARSGSALIQAALVVDMYPDFSRQSLRLVHPLAITLIDMMKAIPMHSQQTKPDSRPLLDLCLALVVSNPFVIRKNAKIHVENAAHVEELNRAVTVFRNTERRQRVQVRQWERSTLKRRRKIEAELLPLTDNLMPRIYVVRMDLSLSSEVTGTSLEELRCFFFRFMNNLRFKPKISKRLLRVIWRLHIRADAVSYYHCQFVLDGALAGEGAEYAKLIGKYWQKEITAGRGMWFDWVDHPSASCRETVGIIESADKNKKAAFMKAVLPYFSDFDLYIRHADTIHPKESGCTRNTRLRLIGSRDFSIS